MLPQPGFFVTDTFCVTEELGIYMAFICTLKKFKRQHKPGPGDEGDVEEANEVSKQSGDQHLQI